MTPQMSSRFTPPAPEERRASAALGSIEGEPLQIVELANNGFFVVKGDTLVSFCLCCRRYSTGTMHSMTTIWFSGDPPRLTTPPLPPGAYCASCFTGAMTAPETQQ